MKHFEAWCTECNLLLGRGFIRARFAVVKHALIWHPDWYYISYKEWKTKIKHVFVSDKIKGR